MAEHFDKVIRIEGDKLCVIRSIANSEMMDMIVIDGREIELSMRPITIVKILLEKIENGPV